MSMQRKAILVKLKIKQYDGFKKDTRVADDVDERYHTTGSAGNYNKRLFDKSTLKPIQRIANKLRADHNKLTIPYTYEGVGILTKDIYFDYTAMVRGHKEAFDDAVENFITQYPIYVSNRQAQLGDLFDPEDYPSQDNMRTRFAIDTKFAPVPSENHFDNDFADDANAEIRESFIEDFKDTTHDAISALYKRVSTVLQHMHDKLENPEHIFRDSTVENVHNIIELLPKLNIFDDERLAQVHEKMNEHLSILTPEDLRIDMGLRRQTVKDTFDLINLLNGNEANGS